MINLRATGVGPAGPLGIFADARAFARHMVKHVFAKGERRHWEQLFKLREMPWRALDKPAPETLLSAPEENVQLAYDQFADVIDDGIKYAVEAPAYIRVVESLTGHSGTHTQTLYWLLAREGFLVCARAGVVRTAFFCVDDRDTAAWNRYRHGLRELRVRAMRAAAGQRQYRGSDNCWAVTIALEEHIKGRYSNAANPWPKPGRPKPGAARDRKLLDWLDGLDKSMV